MNNRLKRLVAMTIAFTILTGIATGQGDSQKHHPLESKITGTVILGNWQENRAYGLGNGST